MNELKRYRQGWKIWKNKYFQGNIVDDRCQGLSENITDAVVVLERVFENRAYLAHNHWIGVVLITYPNGDFDRFVVDTAAGKDTAIEKLQQSMLKELNEWDFDLTNNTIQMDYLTTISPKNYN